MTNQTELIRDSKAADFLTNPNTRFLLTPFRRAMTLSEAAQLLNIKLSTLARRVKQMIEHGLLEVVREEVRAGHRVKLYRATRQRYLVPIEATTHVDLAAYLEQVFGGSAAILSRGVAKVQEQVTPHWGLQIHWEGGSLMQSAVPIGELMASSQVCWYGDAGVRLERKAATAFKEELRELYERYRQQADEKGEWYFFFAGFTAT